MKFNNLIKIGWKIKSSNFEIPLLWPLLFQNDNGCIILLIIFLEEIVLRNSLKGTKTDAALTNIKQKTLFVVVWGLLFGNWYGYNPPNKSHLYSVPRIIVLYFWKDWSKRTKVIKWKSIVSTDWQQQTHHLYSHTMFVAWLLKNQDHENQYVADWRTKDEYFIPQANQDIYCVYCVTFSISSHILQ